MLLASEGWGLAIMIAQALRLHQPTVDYHINDFLNKGKLKLENRGSYRKHSAEQKFLLINKLPFNLFHYADYIIKFVVRTWNIFFSVLGMNKWLHRIDLTYNKLLGFPNKFSVEKKLILN